MAVLYRKTPERDFTKFLLLFSGKKNFEVNEMNMLITPDESISDLVWNTSCTSDCFL